MAASYSVSVYGGGWLDFEQFGEVLEFMRDNHNARAFGRDCDDESDGLTEDEKELIEAVQS